MKKIKILLSLCMALTIVCGSTLTTFATEISDSEVGETVNENNYYFDGYERNENGDIVVRYYAYMPKGTTNVTCGYSITCTGQTMSEYVTGITNLSAFYPCVYLYYPNGSTVGQYRFVIATVNNGKFEISLQTPNGNIVTDDPNNMNNGKTGSPSANTNHILTTNIPIFSSYDSMQNYFLNNDESGVSNKKPITITDENMTYNSKIPTPQLYFTNDGGLTFGFNNASEDYFIEMKGRWWSVDDIELFKQNLIWKYKYESVIKNSLTTWIEPSTFVNSTSTHDLAEYGSSSFDDLLSTYPVDNRQYTGGSNALGNIIFGYNDALSTLKMLLNEKTSSYNSAEIYVRYFTQDANGNYIYGKWCHWLGALAKQDGSSGSVLDDDNIYKGYQSETGLTDDDLKNIENTGNSRNDIDLKDEIYGEYTSPISGTSNSDLIGYFNEAINVISGLGDMLGEFPSLVGQVFSFLPSWVIACIGVGIVLIIILRVVGR